MKAGAGLIHVLSRPRGIIGCFPPFGVREEGSLECYSVFEKQGKLAVLKRSNNKKNGSIPGVNLGGESEESGAEDADEEENNFSVYECPGLAPTGDIEVHNPNFAPQH